jgi:hypothetical protein
MNARERLVKKVIKEQTHYILGGYLNDIDDGHLKELPTVDDLTAEIYSLVINTVRLVIGNMMFNVEKDIRFLGTTHIREMIRENVQRYI